MSTPSGPKKSKKKASSKPNADGRVYHTLDQETLEILFRLDPKLKDLDHEIQRSDDYICETYGQTKLDRALERYYKGGIKQVLSTRWQVPGHPEMGDAWPVYHVHREDFPPARAGFYCTCNRSMRKACTHMLAVWVFKTREPWMEACERILNRDAA